jgi:pyruvate ferredoxin oxidoreductase beta subunit
MAVRGARYLHVLVPCPLGWGTPSNLTIRMARLATQSGLFPVFEARDGEVTEVTRIRQHMPVEDYLRPQKRFAHLFKHPSGAEALERIRASAQANIRRYGLLDQEDDR